MLRSGCGRRISAKPLNESIGLLLLLYSLGHFLFCWVSDNPFSGRHSPIGLSKMLSAAVFLNGDCVLCWGNAHSQRKTFCEAYETSVCISFAGVESLAFDPGPLVEY